MAKPSNITLQAHTPHRAAFANPSMIMTLTAKSATTSTPQRNNARSSPVLHAAHQRKFTRPRTDRINNAAGGSGCLYADHRSPQPPLALFANPIPDAAPRRPGHVWVMDIHCAVSGRQHTRVGSWTNAAPVRLGEDTLPRIRSRTQVTAHTAEGWTFAYPMNQGRRNVDPACGRTSEMRQRFREFIHAYVTGCCCCLLPMCSSVTDCAKQILYRRFRRRAVFAV